VNAHQLTARRDPSETSPDAPDVTITVTEDGPYIVDGDARIITDDGRELALPYDRQLCRCGASSNQPFCDGAHTAIDFDGTLAN
jgi:CDGSH-type Zn-finger protein